MQIQLIRHAEPGYVDDGVLRNNPPLTDLGHRQAKLAAARDWGSVDEIWVSPMVRARQTAAPIVEALGIEPARVFKTLLVELAGSGDLAVGIVPVDLQLDLKAIASAAGVKKCRMADPAMAERVTGYIVGGISPLGQKKLLRTFLDSSAAGFDTINVSAGRRGLEIELAAKDLLALTRGRLADIARR